MLGFQSLLPIDPSQLTDQVLINFNSLVLFYQNDLNAVLTERIVDLRLWYRRLAKIEKDELLKHAISALQHCKDDTIVLSIETLLHWLALLPISTTVNERSFISFYSFLKVILHTKIINQNSSMYNKNIQMTLKGRPKGTLFPLIGPPT